MEYLSEYERVAARLVRALDEVDPRAPVPACPGWTVADLALHIGGGERWAASILLSGRQQERPEVLRNALSWSDWYQATSAALAAALRAVDPAEPCWNFAPVEQRAAFWARRRTHEALIHLIDVHQAAGVQEEVAPELAADGVDEVFTVFHPRMLARGAVPAVTRPVSVRTTDTADHWTLTPGKVARGELTGEVVLAGTAAELLLVLWKRLPADRLATEGDQAVAEAFLAAPSTPWTPYTGREIAAAPGVATGHFDRG